MKVTTLEKPLFIWGAPRSGTTLLYNLMTRHPAVGFPTTETGIPREGTSFWWSVFGIHRGVMDEKLARESCVRTIKKEYSVLLERCGKSRLLDKTPFMTLWIPLVNVVFPDARHFHIIRDGRAVVNSILYKLRYSTGKKDGPFRENKMMYGPQPPGLHESMSLPPARRHSLQWVRLVEHGRAAARVLGPRYCELRYEDLVDTPGDIMNMVLRHAHLECSSRFIEDVYRDELENRNFKWRDKRQQAVEDGFTAHRAIEAGDEEEMTVMNPLLQQLGYEE